MPVKASRAVYSGILGAGGQVTVTARAVAASVSGGTLRLLAPDHSIVDIPGAHHDGDQSIFVWTFKLLAGPPPTAQVPGAPGDRPPTFAPPPEFDLRMTAIGLSPTDPSERDVIASLSIDGDVKMASTVDASGNVGSDDEITLVNHMLRLVIR